MVRGGSPSRGRARPVTLDDAADGGGSPSRAAGTVRGVTEAPSPRRRATAALRALVGSPTAEFRDGQLEAITALVADRRRVLVVQRTGWGKSAVYFVTTALLRDEARGRRCSCRPCSRSCATRSRRGRARRASGRDDQQRQPDAWDEVDRAARRDEIDLLLVSPERFANPGSAPTCCRRSRTRVGLLVIDEVHCISDWGHDFRPDYRRLARCSTSCPTASRCSARRPPRTTGSSPTSRRSSARSSSPSAARSTARPSRSTPSSSARNRTGSPGSRRCSRSCPAPGIVYTLTVADTRPGRRVAARRRASTPAPTPARPTPSCGSRSRSASSPTRSRPSSRPRRSAWATTSPTSRSSCTTSRPARRSPTTSRSAGPAAASTAPRASCSRGHEDRDIQDYFIRTAFPAAEQAEAVVALLPPTRGDWVPLHQIEDRGQRPPQPAREHAEEPRGRRRGRARRPQVPAHPRAVDLRRAGRAGHRAAPRRAGDDARLPPRRRLPHGDPAPRARRPDRQALRSLHPLHRRADDRARPALVRAAQEFLRGEPSSSSPACAAAGGRIATDEQLAAGWALRAWGDGGWGRLVAEQRSAGTFSDELVDALADLLGKQHPDEPFTWVTSVPSRGRPSWCRRSPNDSRERLGLPFHRCSAWCATPRRRPRCRTAPSRRERRRRVRDRADPRRARAPRRRPRRLALDAHRHRRAPAPRRAAARCYPLVLAIGPDD